MVEEKLTQPVHDAAGFVNPPTSPKWKEEEVEQAGEQEGEEALPRLGLGEGGAPHQVHVYQPRLQARLLRHLQVLQHPDNIMTRIYSGI